MKCQLRNNGRLCYNLRINNNQNKNPFIIAGYEGSDYFCDRERETEKLLKAIAKDGRVKEATGSDFLSRHDLGGASSVHLSLNKLLEDELLYEDADGYVVYDRLFGMWLAGMV